MTSVVEFDGDVQAFLRRKRGVGGCIGLICLLKASVNLDLFLHAFII